MTSDRMTSIGSQWRPQVLVEVEATVEHMMRGWKRRP
jgi:hypothetical protein